MGEGKIRKKRPVLLALATARLHSETDKTSCPWHRLWRKRGWGRRGTKDRKEQTSLFTLQRHHSEPLSPPLVLGAGATYKDRHP